jgi:hypothetical protein
MRFFALLVVIISFSYAQCEGSITQSVPAVMGNGGGLVEVTISLVQGDGRAFTSVDPRTGLMTQESIDTAVDYAYGLSGKERTCDVLVDFGESSGTTGYIDGPSAGTALAVMTYALLENRTLRDDTVITGTIDEAGNIGPVGGLYEKAAGASAAGADYFITPAESLYEMLILQNLESGNGIKIIQARKAQDVIGFMVFNKSIEQKELAAEKRAIPVLEEYDASGLESFAPIAEKFILMEKNVSSSLPDGKEAEAIRGFYSNEAMRQGRILERGYVFSAANEAFLNFIDLSTIAVIMKNDPDLPRKKGEAGICLTGIRRPQLTERNFEWIVGADLRQAWAYERINSTETNGKTLIDEQFVRYNELMYAQAWCIVAKELIAAAPAGGGAIDETAWRALADELLGEARALVLSDEETKDRLRIAEKSYSDGRYGAAIFDAVYVIETENALMNPAESGNVSVLAGEKRAGLWAKVYQSHAAFLISQNESAGAYRTALLAKGLDEAAMKMRAAVRQAEPPKPPETADAGGQADQAMLYYAAAAIAIVLLIVFVLLLSRGIIHGDKR